MNLKKPIDAQNISIKLSGTVVGVDRKVTLINQTQLLVQAKNGQKYIPIDNKQQHTYDFEFDIPTDMRLPSSVNVINNSVLYILKCTNNRNQRFQKWLR